MQGHCGHTRTSSRNAVDRRANHRDPHGYHYRGAGAEKGLMQVARRGDDNEFLTSANVS